ncbi:MAG: translation initiation factor [Myxococcota bacterium]
MAKKKREDKSGAAEAEGPFNAAFAGLAALKKEADPGEAIPSPPEPAPARNEPAGKLGRGKIVVRKEKKGRGGKTVTRVEGLSPELDLSEWARRMAKALGCGATVEDGDILLQGHQSDRAAEWLRGEGAARVVVGS